MVTGLGGKVTKCRSHHLKRRAINMLSTRLATVDVNLDPLTEVLLVSLLQWRVALPPPPFCPLWKEDTLCSPHSGSEKLCSTLGASTEHGPLLHQGLVRSPPFAYLTRHSFTSVWTHIYFILWVIIQNYFLYFVVQLWPSFLPQS